MMPSPSVQRGVLVGPTRCGSGTCHRGTERCGGRTVQRLRIILSLLFVGVCLPSCHSAEEENRNCPDLSYAHKVSYRGREDKLLREVLEVIQEIRGDLPKTAQVVASFASCLQSLPADGDLESSPGRQRAPLPSALRKELAAIRWQVDQDRGLIRMEFPSSRSHSFRSSKSLVRVATKITSRICAKLPAGEAKETLSDALWYLWFDSLLRSTGERFDYYDYADEVLSQGAHSRGKSFAVGFDVGRESKGLTISKVLDKTLGQQGLRRGMRLLRLDGKDVDNLSSPELQRYWFREVAFDYRAEVSGVQGSVSFRARSSWRRYPTLRQVRQGHMIYLRMDRFARDSLLELRRILRRGEKDGLEGMILDLRGNGGGIFSPGLVDLFLKPGQTVATFREVSKQALEQEPASVEYYDIPLVLLVDGESASMSEVFAAAIKTHQRGPVVGERTFGKAVGQFSFPIADEGRLGLVTREYYYPGSEESWHQVGIEPDETIEVSQELADTLSETYRAPVLELKELVTQDPVLQRALALLEETQ